MMEITYLVFAFCVGLALGVFFSLSLWSSVRKMTDEFTPWYVLFGSFVFRVSVVIIGFSLVMAGSSIRLIAALLGFITAREIMKHLLSRSTGEHKGVAWKS